MKELVINPDEKAVEAGQVCQPGPLNQSPVNASYFEPPKITDLARQGRLYLLAEGLNGSGMGYAAGQYAIQKVIHSFYTSNITDPQKRLLDATRQANLDIFERNAQHPNRRPLAVTFSAALIHNNRLFVANVGDNRAFVVWDQDIELLSVNNSISEPAEAKTEQTHAAAEKSTPQDNNRKAAPSSFRERLLQGLGLEKEIKINIFNRRLFAGDVVLLCSGGLNGYIDEKEIARAINRYPTEQAIRRLFALASERGYHDACAMSVARMLSEPVAARPLTDMAIPPAPKWSDWDTPATPADKSGITDTKPMTSPPAHPQFKRPPGFMPTKQSGANKKVFTAAGLLVLLLLCAVSFVAARYLLPESMVAAIPFAEQAGLISPDGQDESGPAISRLPSPTAPPQTVTADVSPVPEVAKEAENQRPTPTSESAFAGPVNTPAAVVASVSPVDTPAPSPSPTLIPLPTIEQPPNCENRARFVGDVTIPDGTQLAAGEPFDKAWTVLNAETCPWGPGYTVRLVDGNAMGAPTEIPLRDVVEPDQNFEIRIPMTAPAVPGEYRSEWQLHDLDGEPFGPDLYMEIEVTAQNLTATDPDQLNILFDFVEDAAIAQWTSLDTEYTVQENDISENLELQTEGMVSSGTAQLRGNKTSNDNTLLTYPHQENGFIEGTYRIETPLEPTDAIAATLGFTKLSILSDDGVTFEVTFTPNDGEERVIFSTLVQYQESPITEIQPLGDISPGATGTFTLRAIGGDSPNQDWAVWINARLIRPQNNK